MRYVVLLLIFCISFGVLDSVPRYNGRAPSTPNTLLTTASEGVITYTPGRMAAAAASPGALPAKKPPERARSATPRATSVATPKVAAPRATSAVMSPAARVSTDSLDMATFDDGAVSGGMTAPAASPEETSAAPEGASSAAASPDGPSGATALEEAPTEAQAFPPALAEARLSPAENRLELIPVPLEALAEAPTSLRQFEESARDMTGTPFFRDTIRNLLMHPEGVTFGGVAGVNWSGASATNAGSRVGGKTLAGLTLGVFADVPLNKQLSIRPKTQYAYEGYQPNVSGQRVNVHIAYLHTAADLVYHTDWLQKRFFIGGGPYAAYAASGTYTFKGINTDMTFGNQAGSNLHRMDYGAECIAGLLMDRNFVIGAEADMGARNIALGDTRIHTFSIGLSVIYVFQHRSLF